MERFKRNLTLPFGTVHIASDGKTITRLCFGAKLENDICPVIEQCIRELEEYAAGTRQTFDVPVTPVGTLFQMQVWDCLKRISYGETRTYGEIAALVGSPRGARAVGMACNRNPIGILIPCHRVVGSNGSLTGYAGGLDFKEKLLTLEGASWKN